MFLYWLPHSVAPESNQGLFSRLGDPHKLNFKPGLYLFFDRVMQIFIPCHLAPGMGMTPTFFFQMGHIAQVAIVLFVWLLKFWAWTPSGSLWLISILFPSWSRCAGWLCSQYAASVMLVPYPPCYCSILLLCWQSCLQTIKCHKADLVCQKTFFSL
jgi:hypothetical protein